MDVEALQLAGRFALPPNSLGYCGHNSAPEKFKQCFLHGQCVGVADEITKFIVFHPYLQTIAEILGLDKFDYEVVETDPITGRSKNVSIRQKVRFSKTLGPTEVAHVNAMGVLMPVTGVARANYRVPQKVGILKVPVTVSNDEFKTWYCEAFGTYVYLDIVSGKPVVFTGNTNIGNPVGSNPALDAREKAIQTRVSQI